RRPMPHLPTRPPRTRPGGHHVRSPSAPEIARLAASLRLTGELLEAHGTRTIAAVATWSAGPRSARLDPTSGGNPPAPDNGVIPDPARDTHERLLHQLRLLDEVAHDVRVTIHRANPQLVMLPIVLETPDEI